MNTYMVVRKVAKGRAKGDSFATYVKAKNITNALIGYLLAYADSHKSPAVLADCNALRIRAYPCVPEGSGFMDAEYYISDPQRSLEHATETAERVFKGFPRYDYRAGVLYHWCPDCKGVMEGRGHTKECSAQLS